jgi:rod shape determining protein RodA
MILLHTLKRFDWTLLLCGLALAALGIASVHSASVCRLGDPAGRNGLLSPNAWAQVQWLALSLAVFAAIVSFDYEVWRSWSYTLYVACLVSLVLVAFYGVVRGGAQRWFRVGSRLIQPSEFMKVAVIIALARYLMFRENYRTLKGLAWPFLIALAPVLLILKQPDLGTAILFLPVLFAMLYVAGARPRDLAAVVAAGAAVAPLAWRFYMSASQKSRITAFINPHADAKGAGYQVIESLIAIGTGGLAGKGYMQGSQNLLRKVPELHTDFIFTVICEEWGFVGGGLTLALYIVLFLRMFEIAARTREPFGRLVVVGCATLLAFQTVVNVGMTMRLCPVTGLTLPFVSYGGSSLLTCFTILGLVIGVGVRPKLVMAPADDLA